MNHKDGELKELQKFFQKENHETLFLNDIVFRETYQNICEIEKVVMEVPTNIFLVLPLYDNTEVPKGFLFFGYKLLNEIYTENEIHILKEFAFFLGLRIQSIEMYQKIEDLSINLDKKVDEKTMEFNDLINKQKEFIGMISHEIKTPISSAIFQADSIVDDIKKWESSENALIQELVLLQEQLLKIGELMNQLFSVQYYDTRSITLFRERIDMYDFLTQEIKIYRKIYPHVLFEIQIIQSVGFISIDRVQFRQILWNLVSNSVKQFTNTKHPKIIIKTSKNTEVFSLEIIDNGSGFQEIKPEEVFDRYKTGGWGSAGLGLGLYLCKVIIEMHGGMIEARRGEKNQWASFSITLPLEDKDQENHP